MAAKRKQRAETAPPKVRPASRAPARGARGVRRDRVWHIVTLMATGEWKRGADKGLAREWRLAPKTVRDMSAEASRLLDLTTKQRAKLVKLARVRLSEIAVQDGTDRVPALRTLLDHLGEMPRRYEHSGPDGAPIPVDATARVVVLPSIESTDDEPEPDEDQAQAR